MCLSSQHVTGHVGTSVQEVDLGIARSVLRDMRGVRMMWSAKVSEH